MKDEEMAEEYADRTRIVDENTKVGTDCISLVQDYEGNVIDIHERIKQAFLAGLKAGRPQWHKVADGDLPKGEGIYLVAWKRTVFDKKYGGKFGFQVDYFKNRSFEVVGEYAIAWCEIPTFDKE